MAKKIFARARLVKGARWHIDFTTYDPATGAECRQRKDFDLNEISDLAVREAVGERLARFIEYFAPDKPERPQAASGPNLADAVAQMVAIKQNLPRRSSRARYKTVSKPFLLWAKAQGIAAAPVAEFSKRHARAYWDNVVAKGYRGKSLNNYLDALRTLWNEMQAREMVAGNPWTSIKPAREEPKQRRAPTPEERRIIAAYALEHDYWMFRAIVLQFFCYVRPVELTRLRFRDFNFSTGTVTIQEEDAKQYRTTVRTIPRSVLQYFIDGQFEKYPANFFVFGRVGDARRGHTGPSTNQLHEGRLYKRHAAMLRRLKAAGKLGDIRGLSFYSWKDAGISAHAEKTGPVATKDQAGHTSLSITSAYYHAPEINQGYFSLENDLL